MNSWKVILATLVIFGAGVVTGGLLVSHTVQVNAPQPVTIRPNGPPGNPWHAQSRELLRRMDRELNLTREQRERIEKIIADSQERTRSLWKPIAPQMGREMQSVREGIREELTPEQRKKFDELVRPRQMRKGDELLKEKDKDRGDRRHPQPFRDPETNSTTPDPTGTNSPALKPEPVKL